MEGYIHKITESHVLGNLTLPLHATSGMCSRCNSQHGSLYDWRGDLLCGRCYISSQEQLMDNVLTYISDCGLKSCKICGKVKQSVCGFNLKYNKKPESESGVMTMVRGGAELDHIKREIDKCHLLCSDCYVLVVASEVAGGLI
jgi:hypothetical protein